MTVQHFIAQSFFITFLWSQYDFYSVERDIKHPIIAVVKNTIVYIQRFVCFEKYM